MKAMLPTAGDTIGNVLERNRGVGPGFDLLRVFLAWMVFVIHTKMIAGARPSTSADHAAVSIGAVHATIMAAHESGWNGWLRPLSVAILPMFFALSGFLVAGSAFRLRRVRTFLAFRVLRLWPALLTEIALSAFVLGPIFTTLPWRDYVTHGATWSYLLNLIGSVHFILPKVFEQHGTSIVNINLRTLPAEFNCYLATALLMATGILANRNLFTIILLVLSCILIPLNVFTQFSVTPMFVDDTTLVYYFMVGTTFYHWREKVQMNTTLAIISAILAFLLLESRHTVFLAPIPLVYCTVWFGMLAIPKLPIIRTGDYSYGVYLYGFPICQACIGFMPSLTGHRLALFFVGGLVTALFAIFSWHFIEKPALKLKNHLPKWLYTLAVHIPVQQEPE